MGGVGDVLEAVFAGPDPVRRGPHGLPFGADSYELSFDREYGTLLAYRAFAGDTAYDEATVTRITYGEGAAVPPGEGA